MVRKEIQGSGGAVSTTITGVLTAGATSFTIADATGWPTGSSYPFEVVIDRLGSAEKILCVSRSGTTISCTGGRGYDDTSDIQHLSGVTAEVCATADTIGEANLHTWDTTRDDHTQYLDTTRHAAVVHTAAMLGSSSVDSDEIAPGAIDLAHMSANSVDSAQYVDGSIDAEHFNTSVVTAAALTVLDDATVGDMRTTLGVGTADSPQFTAVNIGHATDTTVARSGAGDLTIEGNQIYRAGGTDVAVTDGGTGASTVGGARTALGIHICADQPARLALSPATGDFALEQDYGHTLIYNGSSWVYTCCRPADITWAARTTALTGEVLAYGQTIVGAATTYPGLWAVVDTAFKSGSNLVVPDLRGNVIAGLDNMGGSDRGKLDLANTMGTEHGTQNHALTEAELRAHTHTGPSHTHTGPSHSHSGPTGQFVQIGQNTGGGLGFAVGGSYNATTNAGGTGATGAAGTGATGSTGSSAAHENMQPTILLNGFIRL